MVVAAAVSAAPRFRLVPRGARRSLGREAVELAASAGLLLDDWQQQVLVDSLGVREDGRWAAFEVGLNVPRQNGKGAVLEARELAGLFLLGERLIIHSAHEQATSQTHFGRLESLIRDAPELHKRVKQYRYSHGEEMIVLTDGRRIVFKTRTKGASRGFSGDLLVMDEAMVISEAAHAVLLPVLRASTAEHGVQVWYAGSAVDQEIHEHGLVWSRVRERGIKGDEGALAYFEWSVAADSPAEVSDEMADDEDLWWQANPALGTRILTEHMRLEREAMSLRGFTVELLGVGDYPATDGAVSSVISLDAWRELTDVQSKLVDPICLAFDVSPDRTASIAAAGRRPDGLFHVEIVRNKPGTGWLPEWVAELVSKHEPDMVVCDGYGPVSSVVQKVVEAGVTVKQLAASEHGEACGQLVDAVEEKQLRHLGSAELVNALRGAKASPLGDAWKWSRKNSRVDISPLVAATLALWAAQQMTEGEIEIF